MIRVVLVAPVVAMRAGLRALLEAGDSVEVIAESAATAELDPLPSETDLLLVAAETISKSDLNAALMEQVANLALLLVTEDQKAAQMLSALPARAWGILPLEASGQELLAAVEALHQGLLVGDPALMEAFLAAAPAFDESEAAPLEEPLTDRESEVLQLLAQGLANKQIAYRLGISEHTVKFHVSSIYAKLGATNRAESVRQGIRNGLIVL